MTFDDKWNVVTLTNTIRSLLTEDKCIFKIDEGTVKIIKIKFALEIYLLYIKHKTQTYNYPQINKYRQR